MPSSDGSTDVRTSAVNQTSTAVIVIANQESPNVNGGSSRAIVNWVTGHKIADPIATHPAALRRRLSALIPPPVPIEEPT
jgi:hypothetical protein